MRSIRQAAPRKGSRIFHTCVIGIPSDTLCIVEKALSRSFLVLALVFVVSGVTAAQANQPSSREEIYSYGSVITVHDNNSVTVVESIDYDTGSLSRHGIYRDIKPYSSEGREMDITVVSVTDEQGVAYPYVLEYPQGLLRIKIGDSDETFSGRRFYIITYRATRAVAHLEDVDEIYWNVTGNEWNIPIQYIHADVKLPPSVASTQWACYLGWEGEQTSCEVIGMDETKNTVLFGGATFPPRDGPELAPGEGMTVAVGFSKGVVTPYTDGEGQPTWFELYWPWAIALLLPLITAFLTGRFWYLRGRDPKGTGVIIPQYDVPDGLTPMEAAGVINERVHTGYIASEIIFLATRGYVKINHSGDLTDNPEYELVRLKDQNDLENLFDQKLMKGLFTGSSTRVTLSSLKHKLHKKADEIVKDVLTALVRKGYYTNLGRMKSGVARVLTLWFLALVGFSFVVDDPGQLFGASAAAALACSVFISVIVYATISHFNPAKSAKGVATKEYLEGLKMYLQIAEKDRLEFHNAPEKRPEVFERLLPYAMVFGVADVWAKEFEGICTESPAWYSGGSSGSFSAVAFSQSLSAFSLEAASALSPAPSSSGGSGGGGSSGGGGGGGGGGSW